MFMDIGAIRRHVLPEAGPEDEQDKLEGEQGRPESEKIYAVQDGYDGNLQDKASLQSFRDKQK